MKDQVILVINAGSSSIKFAIFKFDPEKIKIFAGMVDHIADHPELKIYDHANKLVLTENMGVATYDQVVSALILKIQNFLQNYILVAVGHRVVHGGNAYLEPVTITINVLTELEKLIPLAPLHQPYNLKSIKIIAELYPTLLQVACFDTAFHATQDPLSRMFAIPQDLTNAGIIKYGFHGLSYEYIAGVLSQYFPKERAEGKVLVAHLGNGASCCALENKQSKATSMGFTALEGLMMGTRCGNIDPGVIFYLLEERKLPLSAVIKLLYTQSGLLGVSGIANDIRVLQASEDPHAKQAIALFCYRAARELLALCTILQGLDLLVFTAGIGEHAALIRENICKWLSWLGVNLDPGANQANAKIISNANSKVMVGVVPTNEELMIVEHILKMQKFTFA